VDCRQRSNVVETAKEASGMFRYYACGGDMKRTYFFAIMVLMGSFVFPNEHTIFSGKCGEYNDAWKTLNDQDYQIRYDDEEDVFYFVSSDWISTSWIYLNRTDIAKIRIIFEKYFEWEITAVQNKVKLQREIPDSKIIQRVTWKWGDDWYSANDLILNFTFFSQSETRHQLILATNKVKSSNMFINFSIEGFYFDKEQVRSFYNAISDANITKALDDIKKNKAAESLFN
jgi:hypothetical protein